MVDVQVPKMGMGTVEVDILKWNVEPGGYVTQGFELAEIESEKAVLTIDAPCDGTVAELLAEEGATVNVGDVIARIDPS